MHVYFYMEGGGDLMKALMKFYSGFQCVTYRIIAAIFIISFMTNSVCLAYPINPLFPDLSINLKYTGKTASYFQNIYFPINKGQERVITYLIKKIDRLRQYDRVSRVVVETLVMETAGDGYESMLAVAEVIRNRAKLFKKNYDEVCLMPKQFSCWNDKEKAKNFLAEHKNYYKVAEKAWKESEYSNLVKGSTDYHAEYVMPYWAASYDRVVQVSTHIFYRRILQVT